MASSTPEPHTPTGATFAIVAMRNRPLSIVTRSIAPSAARMPQEMCPPSSAGPDGHDAETILPSHISEISVLVPMSMTSDKPLCSQRARVASSAVT